MIVEKLTAIPNYDGYSATPDGKIYSHSKNHNRNKYGMFLAQNPNHKGYLMTMAGKLTSVHRLVALAYVPNPNNLPQVNHIDGDKLNNHYTNLEWVNNTENIRHAFRTGLFAKRIGGNSGASKLTEKKILNIRKLISQGVSQRKIAKKYGVTQANVCSINKRKTWSHV